MALETLLDRLLNNEKILRKNGRYILSIIILYQKHRADFQKLDRTSC